jgi:hypothetical protein
VTGFPSLRFTNYPEHLVYLSKSNAEKVKEVLKSGVKLWNTSSGECW